MDMLMTNPGYSQIARKILLTLDHKSQLRCRLVCHAWKEQIDRPFFWILKCDQKGQAKSLHDAWNDLFLKIEEGTAIEGKAIRLLKKWHKEYNDWTQAQRPGMTPLHIAAYFGHTKIVKFMVTIVENPNPPRADTWTPFHLAAFGNYCGKSKSS